MTEMIENKTVLTDTQLDNLFPIHVDKKMKLFGGLAILATSIETYSGDIVQKICSYKSNTKS